MALTRKFLTALGIEGDKVDEIITAHTDTVEALKEERDTARKEADAYKADADKLPGITQELEELKKSVNEGHADPFEPKYNELKAEYEEYKQQQADREAKAAKQKAYRNMLKELGVSEKRLESILKITDLEGIELTEDGELKDAEKYQESAKTEWADFIEHTDEQGARSYNPPANTGGSEATVSAAAKRAAEYHTNLYGGINKED